MIAKSLARTGQRVRLAVLLAALPAALAPTGPPPKTPAAPPVEKTPASDPGLEADLAILARLDREAKAPFADPEPGTLPSLSLPHGQDVPLPGSPKQ